MQPGSPPPEHLQVILCTQLVRGRGKSVHAPDRKCTFREVGLCPWNPERTRERCQNNATGVTPDSLSDAADLLVQMAKEQDVMHAQRVKSNGSCLEEVPPSTIGTLRFPSFGGRQKMKKRPGSQHSQTASGVRSDKTEPHAGLYYGSRQEVCTL